MKFAFKTAAGTVLATSLAFLPLSEDARAAVKSTPSFPVLPQPNPQALLQEARLNMKLWACAQDAIRHNSQPTSPVIQQREHHSERMGLWVYHSVLQQQSEKDHAWVNLTTYDPKTQAASFYTRLMRNNKPDITLIFNAERIENDLEFSVRSNPPPSQMGEDEGALLRAHQEPIIRSYVRCAINALDNS